MVNKPKAVGTAAESAVVRALRTLGFPHAERRALAGAYDLGDITGCPGLVFEVKGGEAAKNASDGLITDWMAETEAERANARADVGVLVLQRRGIGASNAHRWWAILRLSDVVRLGSYGRHSTPTEVDCPARVLLADACVLLRRAGYGQPLDAPAEAVPAALTEVAQPPAAVASC
ncbi:hypothetical protein ACLQ2R_17595 [Streptosporangium sp. DT93]|uniref:hypothetical protein n=1 Tax=Streptosporangium sp. DT93 TaxID=3393428 RepID=UPI003CF814C9